MAHSFRIHPPPSVVGATTTGVRREWRRRRTRQKKKKRRKAESRFGGIFQKLLVGYHIQPTYLSTYVPTQPSPKKVDSCVGSVLGVGGRETARKRKEEEGAVVKRAGAKKGERTELTGEG